jgi:hypothetical protein
MELTAPQQSFNIDPHKFQGERDSHVLSPLCASHRVMITSAIIRDMIQHPPFTRQPATGVLSLSAGADHLCWNRVRSVIVDETSGATFETVLRSDCSVSAFAVRRTMELLVSLLARRAFLEQQLHALDSIASAFDATKESITT